MGFFSDLKSVRTPAASVAEADCLLEQPLSMKITNATNEIPNNECRMRRKSNKENHLMERDINSSNLSCLDIYEPQLASVCEMELR